MGLDDMMRMLNTPSIAFGLMSRWYKIVGDVMDYPEVWMGFEDPSALTFQEKSGVWDEGDSKLWAHFIRAFGYTGYELHPDVAIKNFDQMQNRTR